MAVREEDIRTSIEAWLKQQGVSVKREVACGNGIRADLVTPDMVIEVKKCLNRGNIYQAHGQGATYQKLLNKPKLLIIGLAPASEAKYQEAQRIAANIRSKTVNVVFLDKDPRWAVAAAMTRSRIAKARPGVTLLSKPLSKPTGVASNNLAQPNTVQTSRMKDVWAVLWIVMIFLCLKAAFWQPKPEPTPSEGRPELTLPLNSPNSLEPGLWNSNSVVGNPQFTQPRKQIVAKRNLKTQF